MKRRGDFHSSRGGWPAWWKAAVIAISTLALCSCRTPLATQQIDSVGHTPPGLPESAWTGQPEVPMFVNHMEPAHGPPLPYQAGGQWAPPGITRPWPADEYLRDGGDRGLGVRVNPDWQVLGLDIEDAVAHYDTLDGRTVVEPSNRVHIYAPRFAAVRTVSRLVQGEQLTKAVGVHRLNPVAGYADVQTPTTGLQQYQLRSEIVDRLPILARGRQHDGVLSTNLKPGGFQDAFLPFENLSIIRTGLYEQSEKARLDEFTQAAVTWSHDKAVQVIIQGVQAIAATSDQRGEAVYTVEDRRGPPKLRVLKVASTQYAQPGEMVDFTIRFDNIGQQPIGNVTIVDNLTTRLEYEPDSAQSSLAAEFLTEHNEAESLVLRWEIAEPLEPGDGGIVRFRCRVR